MFGICVDKILQRIENLVPVMPVLLFLIRLKESVEIGTCIEIILLGAGICSTAAQQNKHQSTVQPEKNGCPSNVHRHFQIM
jgi:hypothetical protein